MESSVPEMYDVVGIGFGPSGLALAIALEEHRERAPHDSISAAFFERQPTFGWHRNMLLPSAKMQVAFLKDLVTFRNPVSRFSFISYLHAVGRLAQFVNNKDFFPTRMEFHDYLKWAETGFADQVSYNSEVTGIRLPANGARLAYLEVEVKDLAHDRRRVVNARNVVISTGLVPRMPASVERGDRVWHSSEFIEQFRKHDRRDLRRVAVAGGGQSAAEITKYLYDELPHVNVAVIIPSYGYSIADDTPFANQVFDPAAVDDHYFGSEQSREAFWRYHRNTNYSVVDAELIRDLYRRVYEDEVRKVSRLSFIQLTRVSGVKQVDSEIAVSTNSLVTGMPSELRVDVLVCATGYDPLDPSGMLSELSGHCQPDERGRYRMERDYRLVTTLELPGGIYLQGGTEHTHGLSSSLLSNIAVRSGEIVDSIVNRRARAELEDAVASAVLRTS